MVRPLNSLLLLVLLPLLDPWGYAAFEGYAPGASVVCLRLITHVCAMGNRAMGCIFGELLQHKPLLPGRTDPQQLEFICKLLGTPNDRIWPGCSQLPNLSKIPLPQVSYVLVSSGQRVGRRARSGGV